MLKSTPTPGKALLRAEISKRIAELTKDEKARQSAIVYEKVTKHPVFQSASRISVYLNTEMEVDTGRIIEAAKKRGAKIFAPQYAGGNMKMIRVLDGDEEDMPLTKHGIKQHALTTQREDAVETGGLDLVICPGLAFTRSGKRLGHGGGYYDRYLTSLLQKRSSDPDLLQPRLLAVAFNEQIVAEDKMVAAEHDVVMDHVVTAE